MGNPYVVAREIIRLKQKSAQPQYFISHASAFELYQMVTQPHMDIYATTSKQIKATQIDEGKYLAKWRLRLNISEAELLAILRT